ncbi:hypothetical protein ACFL4W_05305, partial [Planctomycetota bacterium]
MKTSTKLYFAGLTLSILGFAGLVVTASGIWYELVGWRSIGIDPFLLGPLVLVFIALPGFFLMLYAHGIKKKEILYKNDKENGEIKGKGFLFSL